MSSLPLSLPSWSIINPLPGISNITVQFTIVPPIESPHHNKGETNPKSWSENNLNNLQPLGKQLGSPQTSDLSPQTSYLIPQTSDLIPQTSDLIPQTSYPRPQSSDLRPETSVLRAQTWDLRARKESILCSLQLPAGNIYCISQPREFPAKQ